LPKLTSTVTEHTMSARVRNVGSEEAMLPYTQSQAKKCMLVDVG